MHSCSSSKADGNPAYHPICKRTIIYAYMTVFDFTIAFVAVNNEVLFSNKTIKKNAATYLLVVCCHLAYVLDYARKAAT